MEMEEKERKRKRLAGGRVNFRYRRSASCLPVLVHMKRSLCLLASSQRAGTCNQWRRSRKDAEAYFLPPGHAAEPGAEPGHAMHVEPVEQSLSVGQELSRFQDAGLYVFAGHLIHFI